jgi:peptidoglycan/xylan/chitin deacetylase (PgdA/CDA1 family)
MRRVTLTFDNGPTPGITEQVLEILSARHIHATFFLIGDKLALPSGRQAALRAHSEGHWIGNHTMTHSVSLGEKSEAEYARREIEAAQELIGDLSHKDKLFRPMGGGGRIGPHLLSPAAMKLLYAGRFTCVLWSSVPGDWKAPAEWVERGVADVAQGDWTVVAIHDVENGALARLPEFLDRLEALGVQFRQDFPEDVVVMKRGEPASARLSQIVAQ